MAIFLAGKAVCYRILAFFCYGKLHFKCESAGLHLGRGRLKVGNKAWQDGSFVFAVRKPSLTSKALFSDGLMYGGIQEGMRLSVKT